MSAPDPIQASPARASANIESDHPLAAPCHHDPVTISS